MTKKLANVHGQNTAEYKDKNPTVFVQGWRLGKTSIFKNYYKKNTK
mgnify:CR=1 FL=1